GALLDPTHPVAPTGEPRHGALRLVVVLRREVVAEDDPLEVDGFVAEVDDPDLDLRPQRGAVQAVVGTAHRTPALDGEAGLTIVIEGMTALAEAVVVGLAALPVGAASAFGAAAVRARLVAVADPVGAGRFGSHASRAAHAPVPAAHAAPGAPERDVPGAASRVERPHRRPTGGLVRELVLREGARPWRHDQACEQPLREQEARQGRHWSRVAAAVRAENTRNTAWCRGCRWWWDVGARGQAYWRSDVAALA